MLGMIDGLNFCKITLIPLNMSRVENKAANALSRRTCLLNQMNIKVVSFDKIKEEYEPCPDN